MRWVVALGVVLLLLFGGALALATRYFVLATRYRYEISTRTERLYRFDHWTGQVRTWACPGKDDAHVMVMTCNWYEYQPLYLP